jgi:hypothetical protein
MPRLPRTPQEKKILARTRDVVDYWGESQKGFRKVKPKKKAQSSRAYRRIVTLTLHDGMDPGEVGISRKRLNLWSGPRLGDHIEAKLKRRSRLQDSPRKSPEARDRRRLRRGKASQ